MKAILQLVAGLYLCAAEGIGGPPCWDTVSPAVKYQNRHLVSGNVGRYLPGDKNETHSLDLDGLHLAVKLAQVPSGETVELTITNCSSSAIQIIPNSFDLAVNGPAQPQRLMHLDPTGVQHNNRTTYGFNSRYLLTRQASDMV